MPGVVRLVNLVSLLIAFQSNAKIITLENIKRLLFVIVITDLLYL